MGASDSLLVFAAQKLPSFGAQVIQPEALRVITPARSGNVHLHQLRLDLTGAQSPVYTEVFLAQIPFTVGDDLYCSFRAGSVRSNTCHNSQ